MPDTMPSLDGYTKAELIEIIREVSHDLGDHLFGFCVLRRAMLEADSRRRREQLDKAAEYRRKAEEAMDRYLAIMKPYSGQRLLDVPLDILKKAQAALAESERYDKLYGSMMEGIT